MPLRGETDATTSLNVKSAIDLQPTELKINPAGKVTLRLPSVKVRLPDITTKLWFLPMIRISGMEITTEPASIEVDLSETAMEVRVEHATRVEILTNGEIKARAKLEGSGSFQGGPMSLEIPAD